MFKGNRKPDFAFGLIVGAILVCVAVLLIPAIVEALKTFPDQSNSASNSHVYDRACYDGEQRIWGPFWGFCVDPRDTFAQWLMMFFSIGAFVYLARTWKTTREIGRDQNRGFVVLDDRGGEMTPIQIRNNEKGVLIEIFYVNVGKTPVQDLEFNGRLTLRSKGAALVSREKADFHGGFAPSGRASIPMEIPKSSLDSARVADCDRIDLTGVFTYKTFYRNKASTGISASWEVEGGQVYQESAEFNDSGNFFT